MIIYIDLIIIINFFVDALLLISVDLLLKRKTNFKKIIYASLIGSFSTLSLFIIKSSLILLIFKLVISIIMVLTAFKYESFKYFKDNLFWLYVVSIILGGSIYLLNNQITLINNGLVFDKNGLKINFILLLVIAPIILYKYIKFQKGFKDTYSNYYDVDIYYMGEKISETGFLDTGNKLIDPYFGRPIILVNKNLVIKEVKTFFIPYQVINNKGLLEVFKPEKVIINKKKIKKVLIGLSDVSLNGVKILLNTEAL
ncbi:MAG: sigma-E processing peptidase SpoIIGA [Bacilli bacterium]|nr:sigma-E processing peptidase SpoIIGA [Bacilli bacterium]